MEITLTGTNQLVYSITVPARLKEIRPNCMNLSDVELQNIQTINTLIAAENKRLLRKISKQLMKESIDRNIIAKITRLTLQEINEL